LHLPVARRGYHSLYIELKRLRGGSLEDSQKEVIAELLEQGHYVRVRAGWLAAARTICWYLQENPEAFGL
jgi:hypothetical protein